MATARWFFEPEPASRFVIQEHLRQGYWRAGPAALWVDAVQVTLPYKAVGHWQGVQFELEWVPRSVVVLRANPAAPELVRATSLQLGFDPTHQTEEAGQAITEWRLRTQEAKGSSTL